MTPQERKDTAKSIAGIVARGYDMHVEAHGPDGSHAIRNSDGGSYLINNRIDGACSYLVRNGEIFEVTVTGTGVSA
jgi:hypothetical protein